MIDIIDLFLMGIRDIKTEFGSNHLAKTFQVIIPFKFLPFLLTLPKAILANFKQSISPYICIDRNNNCETLCKLNERNPTRIIWITGCQAVILKSVSHKYHVVSCQS